MDGSAAEAYASQNGIPFVGLASCLRFSENGETCSFMGVEAVARPLVHRFTVPRMYGECAVTAIGADAFSGCDSLMELTIPDSVTVIDSAAFSGCASLTDVYYCGLPAAWEAASAGVSLPAGCAIHTQRAVSLSLYGATAEDQVLLTDSRGTVRYVTASGEYGLWPDDPLVTITSGAGRRFSYAIGYIGAESGGSDAQMTAGTTNSAAITLIPDFSLGAPFYIVTFEPDDGVSVCHLIVDEKGNDTAQGASWTLTSGTDSYDETNNVLLRSSGGMAAAKMFTLTVIPGGYGCAGSVCQGSTLLAVVSDAEPSCMFTIGDVNADVALSLRWYNRADYHAVRYDGNGGGVLAATRVITNDEEATTATAPLYSVCAMSDVYYLFTGWNTQADGEGQTYQPGEELENVAADITLYAQWTPAWKLSFNRNSGSGAMDTVYASQGSPVVIAPECGFTRVGYAFTGWNTQKNGSGATFQPGEAVTLSEDTALYAQWTAAWTVSFDANGGEKTIAALPIAQGGSATLPFCGFERAGYRFTGWALSADGKIAYADGAQIEPNGDMVLYAVWGMYAITTDGAAIVERYDGYPGYEAAVEAAGGETLYLRLDENALPEEGSYFTGEFTVNMVSLGVEYDESGLFSWPVEEFVMPDHDVTVGAAQARRENVTLDFTWDTALTLPYKAMVQLHNGAAAMFSWDGENNEFMDLNGDGAPDIAVTDPDYKTTTDYSLTLLPGAAATGLNEFTFTGPTDRYGSISLLLPDRPAMPAFGKPDFTLPASTAAIGASAFEGVAAAVVDIPDGCASIGDYAFKDCPNLTQIRIPENVTSIGADIFNGCAHTVYVFGAADSAAEDYCRIHAGCEFIAE